MADFVTSCGGCRGRPACLPNSKRCPPIHIGVRAFRNDVCPCATMFIKHAAFRCKWALRATPLHGGGRHGLPICVLRCHFAAKCGTLRNDVCNIVYNRRIHICRGRPACLPNSKRCLPWNDVCPIRNGVRRFTSVSAHSETTNENITAKQGEHYRKRPTHTWQKGRP